MSKAITELEFVVRMAELGRRDRALYRAIRAEMWEMVAANHEQLTAEQRSRWSKDAS